MELRLGKMTSQELAEWFGVSYTGTYKRRASKYKAILANFCEFTPYRGGVEITEIYCPRYVRNMNCLDDKVFLEEVKRCACEQDGLASVSGISEYAARREEYADLSESQVYYRMRKAGMRLFGEMQEGKSEGPAGKREYEWAVKLAGLNLYRHMTAEERALFNSYTIEWNSKFTPEEIQHFLLLDNYEEYRKNFYEGVIMRMLHNKGILISRATKHEILCDDYAKIAEQLFAQLDE